jgi:hypothetical protein
MAIAMASAGVSDVERVAPRGNHRRWIRRSQVTRLLAVAEPGVAAARGSPGLPEQGLAGILLLAAFASAFRPLKEEEHVVAKAQAPSARGQKSLCRR